MYAAIRQVKAKPGSADALAERIKGAIPIISGVSGFMGYYVIYAPDDTVTAIRSVPSEPQRLWGSRLVTSAMVALTIDAVTNSGCATIVSLQ